MAPSGFCGVHSLPNAGHWCGFFRPRRICAADAHRRFLRVQAVHLEDALGVVIAIFGPEPVAARWDRADAAPFAVADFEDLVDQLLRLRHCLRGAPPGYIGFRPLARPSSSCCTTAQDAFEHVDRLEAGDDDRHPETLGERLVFGEAHDRADVAGTEESLHAIARALREWRSWPAAPARAKRAC